MSRPFIVFMENVLASAQFDRRTERGGIIANLVALWHRWGRNPNARLAHIGMALFVGPSVMLALLVGSAIPFHAFSVEPPKWFEAYVIIAFLCITFAGFVGAIASPLVILFAIWRAGRDSRRQRRSLAVNTPARAVADRATSAATLGSFPQMLPDEHVRLG